MNEREVLRHNARQDWQKGLSSKEIALKYDVTVQTVYTWVKRWSTEEKQEVQKEEETKEVAKEKQKEEIKKEEVHKKETIYEKLLFPALTPQQQELLLDLDVDEMEECKRMIRFCDVQIIKFMTLIDDLKSSKGGLVIKTVTNEKGVKANKDADTEKQVTTEIAAYELILKYNQEIEKAKQEKMKWLDILGKLKNEQPAQQQEEDTPEVVKMYIPNNQRHKGGDFS